ncbi:hypothetical protein [Clostridium sp. ZS2-4]|uniref:hypothetical protein n=1 Tax=Clostridium sp. ZS2-4 TaxID=2987703 RepID=UPI00227B9057|nr:hypothetical protein [Clostridium sp. ZS2-4]MCY6354805.1 hypothetical protein [Clostridium sp. ZS2-4]
MTKKIVVVLSFLFILIKPLYINAQDFKHIEIFDPAVKVHCQALTATVNEVYIILHQFNGK